MMNVYHRNANSYQYNLQTIQLKNTLLQVGTLPCTVRVMCLWATPAGLRAEQVYLPAWLGTAAVISSTPGAKTEHNKTPLQTQADNNVLINGLALPYLWAGRGNSPLGSPAWPHSWSR